QMAGRQLPAQPRHHAQPYRRHRRPGPHRQGDRPAPGGDAGAGRLPHPASAARGCVAALPWHPRDGRGGRHADPRPPRNGGDARPRRRAGFECPRPAGHPHQHRPWQRRRRGGVDPRPPRPAHPRCRTGRLHQRAVSSGGTDRDGEHGSSSARRLGLGPYPGRNGSARRRQPRELVREGKTAHPGSRDAMAAKAMKRIAVLAALLAFCGTAPTRAGDIDPEVIRATAGWWFLAESATGSGCNLKLTAKEAIGGYAVEVASPCKIGEATGDDFAAWNFSQGQMIFIDPVRHVLFRLNEQEYGAYTSDDADPQFVLTPSADGISGLPVAGKIYGTWQLARPNAPALCT